MNHYGALAKEHWKSYRPTRYQQLEDPERFFSDLGDQIADQVQTLSLELTSNQRAELNQLPDLQRIGRLNAIRKQAEEVVFADLIWPQDQTDSTTSNNSPDQPDQIDQIDQTASESREDRLWRLGAILDDDGGLMPRNRQHPVWHLWETSIRDEATQEQIEEFNSSYRAWLAENPDLI